MADDLIERLRAQDGKETAAQIEAEVTARLDPRALVAAKEAFRAFHASWDGSISVAICAYLDALTSKDAALSEMRAELERVKQDRDEYRRKQHHIAKNRAICYVSKDGVEVTDIYDLPVERMPNGYDYAEELATAESQLEMARKALVIANAQLADMEFLTVEGFLGWKKDRARLADGETK